MRRETHYRGHSQCHSKFVFDGGRYNTVEKPSRESSFKKVRTYWILEESQRDLGAERVSVTEQCAQIIDVVQALSSDIPISIDTTKPEVAQVALRAGASILNDVQGLQNPQLMELSADFQSRHYAQSWESRR